jgi:ribosomal protein S3
LETLCKLIELLKRIETGMARRKSAKRATRAAMRITLNGCKV